MTYAHADDAQSMITCASEVGIYHGYAQLDARMAALVLRHCSAGNQQELVRCLLEPDAGDDLKQKAHSGSFSVWACIQEQ